MSQCGTKGTLVLGKCMRQDIGDLNVKEFGIYPVINAKCLKDYGESGDRIKLVFISNMRQMN